MTEYLKSMDSGGRERGSSQLAEGVKMKAGFKGEGKVCGERLVVCGVRDTFRDVILKFASCLLDRG